MPSLLTKSIKPGTKIGIWKIEEDAEALLKQLKLDKKEQEYVQNISSGQRYLHWLSSRVLLRKLLKTKDYIKLTFDANGKPKLINFDFEVSISHSDELAAVMISDSHQVGIDIEKIDARINKVAHKFVNRDILMDLDPKTEIEQLTAYWSAKESLYKLYSKKKLGFIKNLPCEPFEWSTKGTIQAKILIGKINRDYKVKYEQVEDYVLTYVMDDKPFK